MAAANSRLAKCRRASKLSREQLCALAQGDGYSISYPALVQYERGERNPKLGLAIWLSRYFDLTVEELFNGRKKNGDKRSSANGHADRAGGS
jgi:transcriptional regulator with XRE-family HTH domain